MDSGTLKELAIKVSQYFLDFLESDFKRQQAPRRRIVLQTDTGFRSGMKVAAYPLLQHNIWQILEKQCDQELEFKFAPRVYTRPITPTLKSIIREQVKAIANDSLSIVLAEVVNQAKLSRGKAIDNPEQWVEYIRATLVRETASQIIKPLLALLDGPLTQQAYSIRDTIFSAESELVELVVAKLDGVLPEILSKYLASGDAGEFIASISGMITLEDTRSSLVAYFESFTASDAFLEFRDLETYAATGENLQLYLYVGTLRYGNLSFPLFYLPIEVKRLDDGDGYRLSLVKHLYANVRAINFVLQEIAEQQKRQWLSPIKERITYLAQDGSLTAAIRPLFRRVAEAMNLAGQVDLIAGKVNEASNTSVTLSTSLHLATFDKGDEALLNDYEEMISQARKNEGGVVDLFEGIVRGVILENPKSIHEDVDAEWDALPLVDRVVIDSPVPLNEEQIKILSAIRNPQGKIVVVEGPPGTGKSHTITAIAADCALQGRSCLILSDKTEALNVVQNKLSKAMNQVRHQKDFPNPILRLGQDQANFKRLTSNQTLTQVSAYVKAARSNQPKIDSELQETKSTLKENIRKTVNSLGRLPVRDIQDVQLREDALRLLASELIPNLWELAEEDLLPPLVAALESINSIESYLAQVFGKIAGNSKSNLIRRLRLDWAAYDLGASIDKQAIAVFDRINIADIKYIAALLADFEALRMPILGYLFRGGELKVMERNLRLRLSPNLPINLKHHSNLLRKTIESSNKIRAALISYKLSEEDFPDLYALLSSGQSLPDAVKPALGLVEAIHAKPSGIPNELSSGKSPELLAKCWAATVPYLTSLISARNAFSSAPQFDYCSTKSRLELLNVTAMNSQVDGRLVNFVTNSAADAKILASVISQKQKFPESKFDSVKKSFPVIIASIREFGEYMPLVADLFDVVVIDEASQVSVAQALPALLRGRKIVVLGDSKQFSNTKSSNASNQLNEKYRSDLENFFRQRVSTEASMLERLSRFDIKRSVLEFCQICASYSIMLRKHFRSYQELISYSSQMFYGDQLQAIKIRGVPIQDAIRFDVVPVDGKKTTRGTNEAEAEYILGKLLNLLEEEEPPTVGIITPFREQQTLLSKTLFGHAKASAFQERLHLKVMTFDSCQGEERKIIFYSMVATETHDVLNYIFPVALVNAQDSVEEKLKVQRLNVGFSRAEEMIWFVLSKPIDKFRGVIGQALHHYNNILNKGDVRAEATDPNSPMERRVLDWLHKTEFYQKRRDEIEILPQFPIGNYLRQLDPTYQHPAWRVDFLVTLNVGKSHIRIVIEYDGFEYHFQKGKSVNVGNHERYLHEADIERQLTLESYGYRFLRINRFNLGKEPVTTLSDRLTSLVKQFGDESPTASVQQVQKVAEGLATKEMKSCTRCHEILPIKAYFDQSLRNGEGGYGRVCVMCKSKASFTGRSRWG